MSGRASRPQLGRGLAALFGEADGVMPVDPARQRLVPIERIRPGSLQPRRRFAEAPALLSSSSPNSTASPRPSG